MTVTIPESTNFPGGGSGVAPDVWRHYVNWEQLKYVSRGALRVLFFIIVEKTLNEGFK